MRNANIERKTGETDISVFVELDGKGKYTIDSGIGFFDHMLDLFAKHSQTDMIIKCTGDTQVDFHHTVEDCGIALGKAFCNALGDKNSITRYSTVFLPMDEALARVCLDISGRPFFVYDVDFECYKAGNFDAQLCEEFFRAFSMNAGITLHIKLEYGKNTHHIIEAVFKGVARALREACAIDENINGVLSTKGVL